ncbi:hypothetical protein Tco_0359264 [Tanacetum coccineum]
MSTLAFAETHNLVAYLEKPSESAGFEQIVDFLNAHPIRYALTVDPTIYVSCIKQFCNFAVSKTVNEEVQIHATVDGKKIVITESFVRRTLHLVDDGGVDCLPTSAIFENLALLGPYVPSTVLVQAVAATEGNPAIQQHTTIETVLNMTPENKEHFLSEKEAIFLLLTGIGDDIYSTVDACKTANEMWIAIERLQQGESLNVQDVKTNLFWEFRKFTSRDGESMESYYSRFYKLMNELTRNNLQVTTMQVNVQFLQQLQPEWSRFVTVVKQSKEIDTISYHTLFDILKQYQNEVNDIRAERIAKSANPLALLAAAQPYSSLKDKVWSV